MELENVDLTKSSFLSFIVDTLSVLTSNLLFYQISTYREFFLTKAQLPESIFNLAAFLGYSGSDATPAEVNVLFTIPFDSSYRLNFTHQIWHVFNILFFVASNLILGLFIYAILQHFYPDTIAFTTRPYIRIVGLL